MPRSRARIINFRCSQDEYNYITQKINLSGRSKTEFLLDTLKGKEIVVYNGLRDALSELKREGINLNNALRYANYDPTKLAELHKAISNCNALYLHFLELWKSTNGKT